MAVATFPLFISASASELVAGGVDTIATRAGAGITFSSTDVRFQAQGRGDYPAYAQIDRLFRDQMREVPILDDVYRGAIGEKLYVWGDARLPVSGVLFSAQGAIDHITILRGSEGDGVLLPAILARAIRARVGDQVRLQEMGRTVAVTVDGIYRDLSALPRSAYWHPWNDDIYGRICIKFDCPPPPPFVLTSLSRMAALSRLLGSERATFTWEAPVRQGGVTLSEAHSLAAFFDRFRSRISPDGPLFDDFHCCDYGVPDATLSSAMPSIADSVDVRVSQIESPAFLLRAVGVLVALAVLIAAGVFLMASRPVEARLLFARGAQPARVAISLAAEVLVPGAIACAAGLGLSVAVVRLAGPDGRIEGSALRIAERATVGAVLVAVVALVTAAMLAFLRQSEHHRSRLRVLTVIPWELAPIAVSLLALGRLESTGAFVEDAHGLQRPSLWLLGFSILFVAGFGALGARLCLLAYRWWRSHSGRAAPAVYLAARRLTAFPAPTFALVAVATLCLGIFIESMLLVASMRATIDAKAKIFVGSDVAGWIDHSTPEPATFPMPMTRVTRVRDAGMIAGTTMSYDMLAVDPSTFARTAYWRASFSSSSLDDLMSDLDTPIRDGLVPAVVAGDIDVGAVTIGGKVFALDVVGRAEAFPAMSSRNPLIVVNRRWIAESTEGNSLLLNVRASEELWVRGDADEARAALQALRYAPYLILTADHVKDIPSLAAMIDTFLVLDILGAGAALLAIAGTMMYLQARQRAHLVSYALSLHMGMSARTYEGSLRRELVAMLGAAFVVGTVLAVIAGVAVAPLIDPLPTVVPAPLLVVPRMPVVVAGALAALAALGAARLAASRARRTDLGEVMRVAE